VSTKLSWLAAGVMALLLAAPASHARSVEIASLGSLELAFAPVVSVDLYSGQPVAAEVSFRAGEAFVVPSPGRVQQIEYLVADGAAVEQGEAFAVLRGPEMHHLEMTYHSSKELLAGAERRFNSNKLLYQRKTISEGQWLAISEKYYLARLKYEHLRHFFELVLPADDDADALTLGAPMAGIVDYPAIYGGLEEGDSIASFVPRRAVRLKVSIPVGMRSEVARLRVAECDVGIERTSAIAAGFFVEAWSQPLPADCPLLLGQQLLVTPLLRTEAYSVPRTAVFQLEHQSHVLARTGDTLTPVVVNLLAAEGECYLLAGADSLAGQQVLVTSVSAVQGILLGLGDE
jgi:hypothetical protein